jgi:hypothetical protein
MQKQLMCSYSQEMFEQCTKLNFYTFKFLCQKLRASLQCKDTHFRLTISLETRVVVALDVLVVESFYKWSVKCMGLLKI